MYLARIHRKGSTAYSLRESIPSAEGFAHREVLELGSDPARFIRYPGGNAYYLDQRVVDVLDDFKVEASYDELEDLFWPFVKPRIRRALQGFRERGRSYAKGAVLTAAAKKRLQLKTHLFDKQRIHFLKFGHASRADKNRVPADLLKWVNHKSRDEIEQRFMGMETILRPNECKTYVTTIFNLQRFFNRSWAESYHQGLAQDQLDERFIGEICHLNGDKSFWNGPVPDDWLDQYLVRYLIMYFDHAYPAHNIMADYIREFINRHRIYNPLRISPARILARAGSVFGAAPEELKAMSTRQLTRLYRRLARKHHPDKGGNPEIFINITAAYQELLKIKKSGQSG